MTSAPSDSSSLPLPEGIEGAALDPTPPGVDTTPRRWWGRTLGQMGWQLELARLLGDPVYRGAGVTPGDGAPVMSIPGFLVGDLSLSVLNAWLERVGYCSHTSGITMNVRCSDLALDALDRRLRAIEAQEGRPVALIGTSRGGHFAKALAHRRPELVSTVISIGSGLDVPFDNISIPTKAAVAAVRTVQRRAGESVSREGCFTDTCDCPYTRDFCGRFPAEVPLTSIYSKDDGIVWWEACVVPYAHNVEVEGCHVGLLYNRRVYAEVAAALASVRSRSARATAR